MDPLSDVLTMLRPRSDLSGGFSAGGAWSIQFPRQPGIRFQAVLSGECWLVVDGVPDPVRLRSGDITMLPRGRPFRLASDLSLTPVSAESVLSTSRDGMATCNGGGDFVLVGSVFAFTGKPVDILIGILPPLIHVPRESDQQGLRASLELLMQELRERKPGFLVVVQNYTYTILVQLLRLHLAAGGTRGISWLYALADRQMSAALNAMHTNPTHAWTLQELAEHVGLSRSTFALKFKNTVGSSAMDYLIRWRMLLAGDRLTRSSDPISVIALSLGYESESAFSKAFKRTMGCSPRQYARRRNSISEGQVAGNGHGARSPELRVD
jgi:AraC-like DNA-binding protein